MNEPTVFLKTNSLPLWDKFPGYCNQNMFGSAYLYWEWKVTLAHTLALARLDREEQKLHLVSKTMQSDPWDFIETLDRQPLFISLYQLIFIKVCLSLRSSVVLSQLTFFSKQIFNTEHWAISFYPGHWKWPFDF